MLQSTTATALLKINQENTNGLDKLKLEMQHSLTTLESIQQLLNTKVSSSNVDLGKVDEHYKRLEKEYKTLKLELSEQSEVLKNKMEELESSQKKVKEKSQSFKLLSDKYDSLNKSQIEVKKESQQLKGDYKQLEGEHQQIEGKHQQLEGEHQQLERDYQQLEGEYRQLEGNYRQLEEECVQLKKEKHNEECQQLKEECQQLKEECQKLKKEHQKLKEDYVQLKKEHQELSSKSSELQNMIHQIEEMNENEIQRKDLLLRESAQEQNLLTQVVLERDQKLEEYERNINEMEIILNEKDKELDLYANKEQSLELDKEDYENLQERVLKLEEENMQYKKRLKHKEALEQQQEQDVTTHNYINKKSSRIPVLKGKSNQVASLDEEEEKRMKEDILLFQEKLVEKITQLRELENSNERLNEHCLILRKGLNESRKESTERYRKMMEYLEENRLLKEKINKMSISL